MSRSKAEPPSPPQLTPHDQEMLSNRAISTETTARASRIASVPLYSQVSNEPALAAPHAHMRRTRGGARHPCCRSAHAQLLTRAEPGRHNRVISRHTHGIIDGKPVGLVRHST